MSPLDPVQRALLGRTRARVVSRLRGGLGKGGPRLWRLALTAHLPEAASVAPAGFSLRIYTHCGWPWGTELSVNPWSPLRTVGHGPFPLTLVLFCILEIVSRAVCFGQKVIGKSVPCLAQIS